MTRTVVALGGNTLLRRGEDSLAGERRRIREAAALVADLRDRGREVVLTHGNGPQVGNLLLQQEATDVPSLPLDVLVAETQAQIGYPLQRELDNRLGDGEAVTVVTQVRVDPEDPAFSEPTKPVGPFYSREEADGKEFETAQVTTRDGEEAFRRVVPSPAPESVVEADRIRRLVEGGATVVAGGGGGVPVVADDGQRGGGVGRGGGKARGGDDERDDASGGDGDVGDVGGGDGVGGDERDDAGGDPDLRGVEAVVDKDRTSQVLGTELGADELLVLTDVDCAYLGFGTDDRRPLREVTPEELRRHVASGEFGEGSMRPKAEACADFVDAGGDRAMITSPERLGDALAGEAGTHVVPE
ncbi:MAG: carbamate kinase [Haloferacaceae archaeon]